MQQDALSGATWHGTHRGVVLGILPTGKQIGVAAWTIDRIEDGLLAESRIFAPMQAPALIAGWYDAYLNALYRSLKGWRRGNELGGRLEAADSIDPLLCTLFALERHWRPFSSRRWRHLDKLDGQGWQPDELAGVLLDRLASSDPRRQQTLARRVVTLLATRGYGSVYESWDGQIDQALGWEFA